MATRDKKPQQARQIRGGKIVTRSATTFKSKLNPAGEQWVAYVPDSDIQGNLSKHLSDIGVGPYQTSQITYGEEEIPLTVFPIPYSAVVFLESNSVDFPNFFILHRRKRAGAVGSSTREGDEEWVARRKGKGSPIVFLKKLIENFGK
jgi:hypothetical protein